MTHRTKILATKEFIYSLLATVLGENKPMRGGEEERKKEENEGETVSYTKRNLRLKINLPLLMYFFLFLYVLNVTSSLSEMLDF